MLTVLTEGREPPMIYFKNSQEGPKKTVMGAICFYKINPGTLMWGERGRYKEQKIAYPELGSFLSDPPIYLGQP